MADNYFDPDRLKTDGDDRAAEPLSEDMIDAVCRALGDRHRRRILGYLIKTDDGVATLEELLDPLAAISPSSRERLRIALHQNHLTLLAQAGIIEYDRRSKTARYHGHPLAEEILACTAAASAADYRSGESSD